MSGTVVATTEWIAMVRVKGDGRGWGLRDARLATPGARGRETGSRESTGRESGNWGGKLERRVGYGMGERQER